MSCEHHSGFVAEISNLKESDVRLWRSIDAMKTWVILGMGGLLTQAVFFIFSLIKE